GVRRANTNEAAICKIRPYSLLDCATPLDNGNSSVATKLALVSVCCIMSIEL
ncbi:hypothetical protein KI387_001867, partial [Taxus chinensis]